jgi:hypothetical protein
LIVSIVIQAAENKGKVMLEGIIILQNLSEDSSLRKELRNDIERPIYNIGVDIGQVSKDTPQHANTLLNDGFCVSIVD